MKTNTLLVLLLVTLAVALVAQKYVQSPVQYVLEPNEAVRNDIVRIVLNSCHYNGYITIDKYTFMCVRIGGYHGTN